MYQLFSTFSIIAYKDYSQILTLYKPQCAKNVILYPYFLNNLSVNFPWSKQILSRSWSVLPAHLKA